MGLVGAHGPVHRDRSKGGRLLGRTAAWTRSAPGGRGAGNGRAAPVAARGSGRAPVSTMDIINALLAADVDPGPELNMHRPSRGGNSGRFIDPLLNTGCTPLLRATMGNDMEVVRALLDKGASPNVNDDGAHSHSWLRRALEPARAEELVLRRRQAPVARRIRR